MKFGFAIPAYGAGASGAAVAELIAAGEELGFDSAWLPDHVAVPDYAAAVNLSPPFLEPLATCAWGLGATRRLRFGTDVLVAPYRHPLVVAAMAGTLGRLAGDRLILGVGIGYLRGEFEVLGAELRRPRGDHGRVGARGAEPAGRILGRRRARARSRSGSAATTRRLCAGRRCSVTAGIRCGCRRRTTRRRGGGSSRSGATRASTGRSRSRSARASPSSPTSRRVDGRRRVNERPPARSSATRRRHGPLPTDGRASSGRPTT